MEYLDLKNIELDDRFWSKVDKSNGDNSCWEWKAAKNPNSYGRFTIKQRKYIAHRLSYHAIVGELPTHLQLDHICRNRSCVNPRHLEPVNNKENVLRGISPAAYNARKTHCIRGHEFNDENTCIYKYPGHTQRKCIICRNIHNKARYSKVNA